MRLLRAAHREWVCHKGHIGTPHDLAGNPSHGSVSETWRGSLVSHVEAFYSKRNTPQVGIGRASRDGSQPSMADWPKDICEFYPEGRHTLLTSELAGFPQIGNSWCHIETRRVNRFARNGERLAEVEIDVQRFAQEYKNVRKGQFFTGHIPYQDDLIEYLISEHVKSIFILRDPRDLVLSSLHYILGLKRHYLHSFFADSSL